MLYVCMYKGIILLLILICSIYASIIQNKRERYTLRPRPSLTRYSDKEGARLQTTQKRHLSFIPIRLKRHLGFTVCGVLNSRFALY